MENVIVYHGSNHIVSKPEYGKGKTFNDFGLGFYLTYDLELAKEWAVSFNNDGYANIYELELKDLKILDLTKYNILNWIAILIQNRVFSNKNEIVKLGKEYLIKNFSLAIEDYDIIVGYRADDSYFSYAENFLNNTISLRRLEEAMFYGNLGIQIVLKSEKAFEKIKYIGFELASSSYYYPIREKRNDDARKLFLNNKKGLLSKNDTYLSDIIRGVDVNDSRI